MTSPECPSPPYPQVRPEFRYQLLQPELNASSKKSFAGISFVTWPGMEDDRFRVRSPCGCIHLIDLSGKVISFAICGIRHHTPWGPWQ